MEPIYRVPVFQKPIKPWHFTVLWAFGTLIGVILLSIDALSIDTLLENLHMALYPDVTSSLDFSERSQDLRSVLPGLLYFGLIGLVLGSLQLIAAKKLKFNFWLMISVVSWIVGGGVFSGLNIMMDDFRPYQFRSGNWVTAIIAGSVIAVIQVKFLKLARDEAYVWGSSIIIGVLFKHLVSGPIIAWIPFLLASTLAVHYLASEGLGHDAI